MRGRTRTCIVIEVFVFGSNGLENPIIIKCIWLTN